MFVWGAMYLARTVEYAVQAGWSLTVPFVGLLPLAGLGAAESGVNCSVIGVIAIASVFVSIASKLAGAVLGLGGAYLAETGHECRKGCHRLWLFLAEVAR